MSICSWFAPICLVLILFAPAKQDKPESKKDRIQLKISTIKLEPYVMPIYIYDNSTPLVVYEGFMVDLINKVCDVIKYVCKLSVAPGNTYGRRRKDGKWDGLIGEIVNRNTDLAAAPLFITEQRQRVVDFSVPFMQVSATLLLRRPPSGTKSSPINSVTDLLPQSEITYGVQKTSLITRAFQLTNISEFRKLWRNMERFRPSVFTETNEDGIDRVRNEKFAFILPSTIGEYISSQNPCDLMTVDSFLMDKAYGFAFPKNSSLTSKFNEALKRLKDSGFVEGLYKKWWFEKSDCYKAAAVPWSSRIGNDCNAAQTACLMLPFIISLVFAVS